MADCDIIIREFEFQSCLLHDWNSNSLMIFSFERILLGKAFTPHYCSSTTMPLALNNLRRLICHNRQRSQAKRIIMLFECLAFSLGWSLDQEWTWVPWKWKGIPHSPDLQNNSLTIKCWSTELGLQNTPTASLQRGKTPLTVVLDMTLNKLMAELQ